MKTSTLLVVLVIAGVVSFGSAFDYFMFVQRWPGSVCATQRCNSGANRFNWWTIHGLWPQNADGTWPQNCPGPGFDAGKIADLIPSMQKVWPDLLKNDERGFWAHEWTKHGTCATSKYFNNQYDYFFYSVKMQSQINLVSWLGQRGISPGGSYPIGQITQAVKSFTNSLPQLHCVSGKLVELRVCLDKELRYTNCAQKAGCPANISLPLPPTF